MNRKRLFEICNVFEKQATNKLAGTLQFPKELVDQISDWAIARYAALILSRMEYRTKNRQNWLTNFKSSVDSFKEFAIQMIQGTKPFITDKWEEIPFFSYLRDEHTGLRGIIKEDQYYVSLHVKPQGDEFEATLFIPDERGTYTKSKIGTFSDVQKFVRSYSSPIMNKIKNAEEFYKNIFELEKSSKDLTVVKGILQRLSKDANIAKSLEIGGDPALVKYFEIDISTLPYFKETKQFSNNTRLSVSAEFKESTQSSYWHPNKSTNLIEGKLYIGRIVIARNTWERTKQLVESKDPISILKKELDDITRTVRHETQHLIQGYINILHGLEERGGLPSFKYRDPEYNPHGAPRSSSLAFPGNRLEHELRDVEFYTRLSDEIHNFNRIKTTLPISLIRPIIMHWIGETPPNFQVLVDRERIKANAIQLDAIHEALEFARRRTFFKFLKLYQITKYRKAVKEFIKAVS